MRSAEKYKAKRLIGTSQWGKAMAMQALLDKMAFPCEEWLVMGTKPSTLVPHLFE